MNRKALVPCLGPETDFTIEEKRGLQVCACVIGVGGVMQREVDDPQDSYH